MPWVGEHGWFVVCTIDSHHVCPLHSVPSILLFFFNVQSLTIQDPGGDGMGSEGSVNLYLLDSSGDRYPLASVLGSSVQDMLIVNFSVPSGCAFAFAPPQAQVAKRSRRGSKKGSPINHGSYQGATPSKTRKHLK
jgi:hypothetical protein